MRLRTFANKIGVSYTTALRMFKRKEIPGAFKLPSGTIIVPDEAVTSLAENYQENCTNDIVDTIIIMLSDLDKEQLVSIQNAIYERLVERDTDVSE